MLYPSSSGVMVNMGPSHLLPRRWPCFLIHLHTKFFFVFRAVTKHVVKWMYIISVVYRACLLGNLEKSLQQHALLFLCMSNFRPLAKCLAYAIDSCWNAASWILGQGERALPFFKGSYNWRNNFLEEPCHSTLDALDSSHRIPRENGFSLAQLEMWPCNLCCGWWPR